jgi:predicted phage terminase large subunit-like protein
MDKRQITLETVNQILEDQKARRIIVKQSHFWFFHLYFFLYVKYPTATYQIEMLSITEDEKNKLAVIVAFRGSAKSTIMTMSFPLWAILGRLQKKCVVIFSQTQHQAKSHFLNLKRELEGNELLKADLGPFEDSPKEWGSYSLIIPQFDARIIAASTEQSIRGIRHGAHRPDLIICDDIEDINSVKTKESREKMHDWFKGDILPLGDKDTKIVVVGNLLHEDSVLMRLKNEILANPSIGIFREYPLVGENGNILWPGKYASKQAIENERLLIGDDKAWQREYLLKIIADEDQIVNPEWIQYYDRIPENLSAKRYKAIGVDLAISDNTKADYTAIVSAQVHSTRDKLQIYILPNPINEQLDYPKTMDRIHNIANIGYDRYQRPRIYIEDVGYQKAVIQQLEKEGYLVEGYPVGGKDKRARLASITDLIRDGTILFPRDTAKDLIQQLLYFGVEKHDDLVDALTALTHMVIKNDRRRSPVKVKPSGDPIRMYIPNGGYR